MSPDKLFDVPGCNKKKKAQQYNTATFIRKSIPRGMDTAIQSVLVYTYIVVFLVKMDVSYVLAS